VNELWNKFDLAVPEVSEMDRQFLEAQSRIAIRCAIGSALIDV